MPVSATLKMTLPDPLDSGRTRTSPSSVNLSALETRFRKICETFGSSVWIGPRSSAGSITSATRSF